jgi:hypothetical protein
LNGLSVFAIALANERVVHIDVDEERFFHGHNSHEMCAPVVSGRDASVENRASEFRV